jgi:dephospho-CoA kinase
MKMLKKVFGLTGGIGSGKSTLAKILQKKYSDIEVFDCDNVAKKIMEEETKKTGNVFDKKKIAKIIFNNPEEKIKLERLIHPKVWHELDKLIKKLDKEKIVLVETAILFETGKNKDMFKNIGVVCGLTERKRRIKKRNNWSDEEINLRIKNQSNQEIIKKKTDVIIDSECSLKELEGKAEKLYEYLVNPTKEKLIL